MTKTCSQCGAVLPSGARVCDFCDSSFSVGFSGAEELTGALAGGIATGNAKRSRSAALESLAYSSADPSTLANDTWRGELAQRYKAYRTRHRRPGTDDGQGHFTFDPSTDEQQPEASVALEELTPLEPDFSFTIAIGRSSRNPAADEAPLEIDVSSRPDIEGPPLEQPVPPEAHLPSGRFPVASMDDRRLAAIIDLSCLLFAYGGFLGLFGSLGGHFTLSKLSVAVCATTLSIVYLQYFALFTIFGGTTPGMMLRGLQVVSFSGESPTPRQMLLRSAGYLISAGTFFLGFLWAMWDEDELTWHDRLSRTYLSEEQTLADLETSGAAHSR